MSNETTTTIESYYVETNSNIRNRQPKMAICYDFDKTLSPDDMQSFTLIPSFGIDKGEFWSESNGLAKDNRMDTMLVLHKIKTVVLLRTTDNYIWGWNRN